MLKNLKLPLFLLSIVTVVFSFMGYAEPLFVASPPVSFSYTNIVDKYTIVTSVSVTKEPETKDEITNSLPVIEITSPENGLSFTFPVVVSLSAEAADIDGTIAKVVFLDNNKPVSTNLVSPYTTSIAPSVGSPAITAIATDNLGSNTVSSPVSFFVIAPNVTPTISLTSPANNQVFITPANIVISANANDLDGVVSSVQFFRNNAIIGADTIAPYSFIVSNLPPGSYQFKGIVTDNQGATSTSSNITVLVNAPNVFPTISISSLTNTYTAPATIIVNATVKDTDGTISSVQFFKNGVLAGTDSSSPYLITLSNVSSGAYQLTALATDNTGATTLSSVLNITVNVFIPPVQDPPINIFSEKIIFYRGNLTTTTQRDRLLSKMIIGANLGWNALCIEESGCMKQVTPNTNCLANLNYILDKAEQLGLAIIPSSFNVDEPMMVSPIELREAFPVKDTKFVRNGDKAFPVGDPSPVLVNGNFEVYSSHSPNSWTVDAPGVVTFIDTVNKQNGNSSLRFENPYKNPPNNHARAYQYINVVPFHAYKIEGWARTEGFSNPALIKYYVVGASNNRILWSNRSGGLGQAAPPSTQGWSRYSIDINSLENSRIILYVMCSGSASGKVWFDNISFSEVGLHSMVRRDSTPIIVKDYAGTTVYNEGSDYIVANEALAIPFNSTIPENANLKVSWWQLANMAELSGVPSVICNPYYLSGITTIGNIVYDRMRQPKSWHIRINETRVGNWSCDYPTMGDYLADLMRKTEGVIDKINPEIKRYIWNDMYDPYHNCIPQYVMTRGSLLGAWNGISTNAIVFNWYNNSSTANMKFWSGLDPKYPKVRHKQILALYYEGLSNVTKWLELLTQAEAEGVRDVVGCMYTTWASDSQGNPGRYDDLEAVTDLIKKSGRWK